MPSWRSKIQTRFLQPCLWFTFRPKRQGTDRIRTTPDGCPPIWWRQQGPTGLVCYKHNQEGMLFVYLLVLIVFHEIWSDRWMLCLAHSGVSQQCMTWHMYKLCANSFWKDVWLFCRWSDLTNQTISWVVQQLSCSKPCRWKYTDSKTLRSWAHRLHMDCTMLLAWRDCISVKHEGHSDRTSVIYSCLASFEAAAIPLCIEKPD